MQAAVTRNPSAGIDLEHLIADELLAFRAKEGEQGTKLKGSVVRLRPKAAETLALAIHELATNAVKHGALSAKRGRIAVTWRIEEADRRRLVIEWVETGARLSETPRRRGFGTELIERTLVYDLGAETSLRFEPTGLRCTPILPADDWLLVE